MVVMKDKLKVWWFLKYKTVDVSSLFPLGTFCKNIMNIDVKGSMNGSTSPSSFIYDISIHVYLTYIR